MKRLLFLLPLLALLFSCGEKPEGPVDKLKLEVGQTELTVPADATSASFEVRSNAAWRISCFDVYPTLDKDRWLSGYTKKGENDGTVEISFTANASTTVTRTAVFRVISGEKSVDVQFSQMPSEFAAVLDVDSAEKTVAWDATAASFTITANVPWTTSVDGTWIHSFTQGGSGDGQLTLDFDRNADTVSPRTATITVSSAAGNKTLTLTQEKAPEREQAEEVNLAGFFAAAQSDQVLYRLTGLVDRMISVTYGSMRIVDDSGAAMIYCLLTGKDGEDGQFERLGVQVGDCITVVGKRGPLTAGPEPYAELVGGYYESHKSVRNSTLAAFLSRPDGNANWYRLSGTVSNITDAQDGCFTLTDGALAVHVNGLISGVGAARGSYAGLGIKAGAKLTLIATQKSGDTTSDAIYLSHSNPGLSAGVAARWTFDVNTNATAHFDQSWTGMEIDADGHVDATEYDNKAGDGGRYVDAVEGDGRLTYVQVDKTSLDAGGKSACRIVFYSAQPGVRGAASGDYFLFSCLPATDIPAGTKFSFSFCLRPENSAPGYFMVEYLDGDAWTPVSGLALSQKEGIDYNLARAGSEQTLTTCQFRTSHDMTSLQIRITITAPYTAAGNSFQGGLAGGGLRFRGVVSGKDLSPVLSVVE